MKKNKAVPILIFLPFFFLCTCHPPSSSGETDPLEGVTRRDMVSIAGGIYIQTDGTLSFQHQISDFSLARYEVTYELWYNCSRLGLESRVCL